MIKRGVYCHMVGHRKGQPYQINYIRKVGVVYVEGIYMCVVKCLLRMTHVA